MMGHPILESEPLQNTSEDEKDDLAGEAMFLPNLASVLVGIYLNAHAPWWNA